MFAGEPEKARERLDSSSEHYREIGQRTEEKLADPSSLDEEEMTYYQSLEVALDEDRAELVHPATFHQRLLGNQLIEGKMAPSYCLDHFAGFCSAAVNRHIEIVQNLYDLGQIDETDYLQRVEKAEGLKQVFDDN